MTPLAALLAERIRRFGPITFAEYMRECLYHPVHGYYSKPEARRFSDYYTSVDVHPIFGRLLARQFAEMWHQLDRPGEFLLVEAAAGTGRLAGHILEFAQTHLPDFFNALNYIAVERSPARCDQLAAHLSRFIRKGKCRLSIEIPARIPIGCVFSNELLDALPVHRVLQQAGALKEIFVTCDGKVFSEIPHPLSTCAITEYFAAQQITLEEGQLAEAGLEACDWITEIARRLNRGFVLTIDYGHEAADLFDAHHQSGTVVSYAKHQISNNLYAAPGEQDLTAHVNFTALRQWGARHGLETLGLVTQTAFLLALGKENDFADLYENGMDESGRVRARLQLKTLIYPEGLGERFQILLQQKNVPQAQLTALRPL
ncbi:MAG TPA: SAM-dependent methyltransferase [Candidatus Acidoferrales bacterium]|nr:SAM-dependent methyltransferase [Candidatus Acidoferrales bacterium]